MNAPYTTQLGAGLGLVDETKTLLDLWEPEMSANQLNHVALETGRTWTVRSFALIIHALGRCLHDQALIRQQQ